jgi:hypothetical protein
MKRRKTESEGFVGRGVWIAQWKVNGAQVLVAVTTSGDRVAETIVSAGIDAIAVCDELWRMLDTIDPVADRLRIVR